MQLQKMTMIMSMGLVLCCLQSWTMEEKAIVNTTWLEESLWSTYPANDIDSITRVVQGKGGAQYKIRNKVTGIESKEEVGAWHTYIVNYKDGKKAALWQSGENQYSYQKSTKSDSVLPNTTDPVFVDGMGLYEIISALYTIGQINVSLESNKDPLESVQTNKDMQTIFYSLHEKAMKFEQK